MYSPFFSYHFYFFKRGGPNSITKLNGGPWPDWPPPGSAMGVDTLMITCEICANLKTCLGWVGLNLDWLML